MNNAGLQAAEKLCRVARTSRGHLSETSLVCLVDLVCFVYLAHQVYPVSLFQPNKQDKPNKPIKRDRPDRPNRPDEQDRPADFFSILLDNPLPFLAMCLPITVAIYRNLHPRRCCGLSLPDVLRAHRPCRLIYPLDSFSVLQKILPSPSALSWLAICG